MGNSYRGRPKLRRLQKPAVDKPADQILKELRPKPSPSSNSTYREQSLKIHGFICAKCAREFDFKTRHLLTVHHKDGNHHNNPPDGSNWENLCTYCHDDEHSRGILGDYLRKEKRTNLSESVYNPSNDRTNDLSSNAFFGRQIVIC